MFLANSLNDKLKRSLSQFDLVKQNECKFPYQRPTGNPKLLINQKENPEYSSDRLAQMTRKDFEKKFTISKLKQKWGEKHQINFDLKHRKFMPDVMSQRAKTAKTYVKDLLDPDLFETKVPRWNICTKLEEKNFRVPLKKTIFEVNHGLNNFQVVPLKEKSIEPGVDTRYELITDKNYWNNSAKLEKEEKKEIEKTNLDKAMYNTQVYWQKTELNRIRGDELPITEERRKVESARYYKPYRDPKSLTKYHYNLMKQVKENTWIEREKITEKIKHDNPGCEKYKEKIDSLVQKNMYNTYRDKFDILVGKKKEKAKDINTYDWKDVELIDKIETVLNWKDIDWYKPAGKTTNNFYQTNIKLDDNAKKRELINPLVTNYIDVFKEENNIKERKLNEYKKKLKLDLMKKKTNTSEIDKTDPLKVSKYPVEKNIYELQAKFNQIGKENDESVDYSLMNYAGFNTYQPEQGQNKKYFLDAFKKVVTTKEEKRKKVLSAHKFKRTDQWIEYKYYHPGTFREFDFGNTGTNEGSGANTNNNSMNNTVRKLIKNQEEKVSTKVMAWSCCMNTCKDSKGCHKERINKHKWNLDHF